MTKQERDNNFATNLWLDKVKVTLFVFVILGLAYLKLLDWVPTEGTWIRYALPLLPLGLMILEIALAFFRKAK